MYCRGQLVELQRDLPMLERAGYGLAAVSYDSAAVLRDFAARRKISFPLLADHESDVIGAFGVVNGKYAQGTLLDVKTEQVTNALGDVPVFGVAYPSVFVMDPYGKVVWRFVSEADELRLTGAAILERSVGTVADAQRHGVWNEQAAVTAVASNAAVGLGNRLWIGVELKIPPGFHVYGPGVGDGYRGMSWHMNSSSCWYQDDAELVYPTPTLRKFAFAEGELPVYLGSVRITREIVLKPVLSAADPSLFKLFQSVCLDSAGNVKASGALDLQVCDERKCYPPRTIPLEWKFKFTPPDMARSPGELRREFEQQTPPR